MIGPLDNALWLGEFILELAAFVLVFKNLRTIKILWAYLAFRAVADLAGFAIASGWNLDFYGWSNYGQRLVGYVLLAALAMRVIGVAFNADRDKVKAWSVGAAGITALAIAVLHRGPWTVRTLYSIGFRVDMAIAVFIAGALFLRDREIIVMPLEKHWSRICSAVLIAIFTHAVCSELNRHGITETTTESRLMAVGQLLALGTWIAAAWSKPVEFEVMRLDSIGSPNAEPLIVDEVLTGTVN